MAAAKPKTGGKGGGLNKKLGPLPVWAWLAIGAAGIVAGIYIKRRMASATQQSTSSTPPDTSTVGTQYPDLGGATSGGGAGSLPGNNFPDLGSLLSQLAANQAAQQQAPQQAQPFTINEPAITLPAQTFNVEPVIQIPPTISTSPNGGKITTSARSPVTNVSPVVATNYGSSFLPINVTSAPTVYQSPAGTTLATVYNTPHTVVVGPSGGSVSAKTVAAARPGGVSSNKAQGVYSIH